MVRPRYNTAETRADLLREGRRLFTEVGYAMLRAEDIVGAAGLTRGALYHHFDGKLGLFRSVVEELQDEITSEVKRHAELATGPLDALRAGFQAYLDIALRADIRRLVLLDGPAVLGWTTWHEIDQRHAYGLTRAAVERAIEIGELPPLPVDGLTRVLLGAVTQASLDIGRSSDPIATRREIGTVVDLLIDRLSETLRLD